MTVLRNTIESWREVCYILAIKCCETLTKNNGWKWRKCYEKEKISIIIDSMYNDGIVIGWMWRRIK